jgi:hypothetical protein
METERQHARGEKKEGGTEAGRTNDEETERNRKRTEERERTEQKGKH